MVRQSSVSRTSHGREVPAPEEQGMEEQRKSQTRLSVLKALWNDPFRHVNRQAAHQDHSTKPMDTEPRKEAKSSQTAGAEHSRRACDPHCRQLPREAWRRARRQGLDFWEDSTVLKKPVFQLKQRTMTISDKFVKGGAEEEVENGLGGTYVPYQWRLALGGRKECLGQWWQVIECL